MRRRSSVNGGVNPRISGEQRASETTRCRAGHPGGCVTSSRFAAPPLCSGPSGDLTQPPDTSGFHGRKRASGHDWPGSREHAVPGCQPPYLVFARFRRFCVAINIIKEARSWDELHRGFAQRGMRYARTGSGATIFRGTRRVPSALVSILGRAALPPSLFVCWSQCDPSARLAFHNSRHCLDRRVSRRSRAPRCPGHPPRSFEP